MTTPRVVVLDLEPADGNPFPEHEAGAHIDVLLDQGGARQYSLCGEPGNRGRVLHLDDQPDDQKLELRRDLGSPAPDTAVYVCGPDGFIDYILDTAAELGWPSTALHKERFTPSATTADAPTDGFTVRLASTGAEYQASAEETILDVLLRNGVDAPSSCQQGICGECVVRVLAGEPDHRDDVLTDEERAEGLFTTCSSRALGPSIELDL
jgi:vanillate monooxygenase ferredoxin subunit